jgi:hypothetical protein
VDQQTIDDLERYLGEVFVRPVDGVARLKPHHAAPSPLREIGTRLLGVAAVRGEGRINRPSEHPHVATQINIAAVVNACNARMSHVRGAEYTLRFPFLVGAELFCQLEDRHDAAELV